MVLDEDEEESEVRAGLRPARLVLLVSCVWGANCSTTVVSSSQASKQEAANLEKSISQHVDASKAGAEGATSPTAAAAAATSAAAGVDDVVKPTKVVLQDDELQAVATALTHIIMDFDNLFLLGP